MNTLQEQAPDAGCSFYGMAAQALNHTIDYAHARRLTRQQAVMFYMADMMTLVEVGAALARKSVGLDREKAPKAEKYKAMSRVFAGEVAHGVGENALKVVMADEAADQAQTDRFLSDVAYQQMLAGRRNWLQDMDRVADFIFER